MSKSTTKGKSKHDKVKRSKSSVALREAVRKLRDVDAMFAVLEEDKRLPSFPEFLIACLIMGNAERVNLKAMFPEHCKALSACLPTVWYNEQA